MSTTFEPTILEITLEEIEQSQLGSEDLRGLAPLGPSAVRCDSNYCESGYSSEVETTEGNK